MNRFSLIRLFTRDLTWLRTPDAVDSETSNGCIGAGTASVSLRIHFR